MSLIDDIQINSLSEAHEILKGIGADDNLFEKAHKDGDLHPNGKWVWVSSAAGGKGDWRTLNGRTHKKHTAANGAGSASSSATAGNSAGSGSAGKSDGGKVVGSKSVAGTAGKSTANGMKKESGKVSDVEFKRIVSRLKSDPDNRDASRYLEEEEMSDAELQNFLNYANKFKIDSANLNKMTRDRCAKWAKLALEEKADRDKSKKKVISKKTNNVTKDDDPNVILDNFNKEYKITSLLDNGIPTSLSNYAFGLSTNKKNKDYPWLDNTGTADQRKAITYEIASSIKFGADAVANRLNASDLGYNNWEVVTKNPLKIKSEDRNGNVNYILIQKVKSYKTSTPTKKTTNVGVSKKFMNNLLKKTK